MALTRRELTILAVAFVISLPAVTPRIYASDEIQYFSYLRSLWFDRDVSFENEYRYFYEQNIGRGEGFHATFLEQSTDAGRRPSFATIGSAILWSPFYLAGDIVARAGGAPADGFSRPYVAAVAYGSAFYGFAALLLSIHAARRLIGISGPGPTAAGLVLFGTPLLFYMYVSPPYSHACSAFAVALFVTVWLHVRERWSVPGAIALGLSGALMAMVREQDAILVIGPALDFGLSMIGAARANGRAGLKVIDPGREIGSARGPREARSRRARASGGGAPRALINADGTSIAASGGAALWGCIAFAVGLLPQLFAYQALNGHFGPSKLVTRKMIWTSPHAWGVLASPEHGFLVWTPLAAIAIAGLVILATRGPATAKRVGACALVMVGVQIYVSGSVDSWTVAGAFGQRRFVALTILLTIGIAAVLAASRHTGFRVPIAAVLALCVWWNVALIVEFGTGLMNRQRLEPRKNAYDAFVTVPRMVPALGYRYLFDRPSFYQQRPRPATEP